MLMISKRCLVFCLWVGLSGCASQPSSLNSSALDESVSPTTALPLELLAENRYLASKRPLTAENAKWIAQALNAHQAGQRDDASALIEKVIQTGGANSAVWVFKGDLAVDADISAAQADYEQALQLNMNNYLAANRLAALLRQQGEFSQAQAYYLQAIDAYPGYLPSYLNLAILLDLYMVDKAQALQRYQQYDRLKLADDDGYAESLEQRQVLGWLADLHRQIEQ